MTRLVEELMREHKAIIDHLNQIKAAGVTSDTGKQKLLLAKKSLLAHLKKEDQHLYPKLHQAAQSNAELKRTLDLFAKNMDKISTDALNFFAKYENGGTGLEFAKDFGSLVATLNQRIQKEETILYLKFNELT